MNGKSLKMNVTLIDGDSLGRVKCTIQNRTVLLYKIPRSKLSTCSKDEGELREHLKRPGVYFLLGKDDGSDKYNIYIGQSINRKNGEGLLFRLIEHDKSNRETYRDKWNEAFCVSTTSTDEPFGATEISYLEHKFTDLARKSERCKVSNKNDPNPGNVNEDDRNRLDEIVDHVKLIMGVMGKNLFDPYVSEGKATKDSAADNVFYYQGKYDARSIKTNEGFVLLKGSHISPKLSPSSKVVKVPALREEHSAEIDESHVTTKNILFYSSSSAASFVRGSPANGNAKWKTKEGKSPKDF